MENIDTSFCIYNYHLIATNNFFGCINVISTNTVYKSTKFKIMLTTDRNTYPHINILGDEIGVNFNAFYKARDDRKKAIEHIKALLEEATYIEIIDKYQNFV